MIQQYNRCYPQYGIQQQQPPYMMINAGIQQQKGVYQGKETRKAIDHYSYALNEEIGRGFSSKVYRGRDENTQQTVAVKVIDMKMVKQSIHAVLLKNEISALKSFNSKNILKLFDVFQTQNNTYLITEYCDSGDLSARIKKKGRLDEAEGVRILKEIIQGLYEINQKGFIHRDIKPANILMDNQTPKIADFGFAVQLNSNDARSQSKHFNVGTPLYMSPQALRQQGHSEKGDVWAIGVMYYELLYGRPPFTAQSEAALLSNILHQGLQLPANPFVSEQSKDLIRRCLQIDESKRLRVKDLASHSLVAQERPLKLPSAFEQVQERIPLKQINNQSNFQKDKRSHSQGVRDFNSRPIKSENIVQKKNENISINRGNNQNIFMDNQRQNKRSPTDISANIQMDQKEYVNRSKSQKHMMLDTKAFKDLPISPNTNSNQNIIKRQQSQEQSICTHDNSSLMKKQKSYEYENNNDNLSRRVPLQPRNNNTHHQTQTYTEAENKPQQTPKFKGNNDILFSQINFCRFLYKFSQQLSAGAKQYPKFLNSTGLRDKLMFLFSKNIITKISKLQQLNEKENYKENVFQLDEFESYRKSESFCKFSQAIWEYNEKYRKHFEKMYLLIQKNGHTNDKKFEAVFDREFNEFDSFYLIAQTYVKSAIQELFQDINKINDKNELDSQISTEVIILEFNQIINTNKAQFYLWVIENLIEYLTLINLVLNSPGDYRNFLRNAKVESLVDKKPKKYTLRDLNDIQNKSVFLK